MPDPFINYILLLILLIFYVDFSVCFSSMKLNLIVFLADLFNVMEIHPVSCVRDKFSTGKSTIAIKHLCPRRARFLYSFSWFPLLCFSSAAFSLEQTLASTDSNIVLDSRLPDFQFSIADRVGFNKAVIFGIVTGCSKVLIFAIDSM